MYHLGGTYAWYMMTSKRNIFNHLYNNYNCGIIKEVRCVEKLELRLAKHINGTTFNLRCLQEKSFLLVVEFNLKVKTILKGI